MKGKRKNWLQTKRRIRHKEKLRTDMPYRDKTLGQCCRREYGGGVVSGSRKNWSE
jgi:hypothetical protein